MGSSDLRNATIGEQFDAGDERRIVGSEEQRRPGDVVGLSDATDRHLCGQVVEQALLLRGLGPCELD
jgi:hypothetical protein